MSSELKSETSRINGAKSRGPHRAPSPLDPACHRFTPRTLTLENEPQAHFLEMLDAYFYLFLPANQLEIDMVCDIVAARWRLRRIWRYQTAMLDVEMDAHAPVFEKTYQTFDEDMRGAIAFSAIADKSKGYATALRTDIHLTRTYRRAVDDFRRLRGGKILPEILIFQNEPEDSDITPLDTIKDTPEISTEPSEPKDR